MAFDLYVDKDTNDLVYENGTIRLTSTKPELLRQRLSDAFKTWRGEWFNNTEYGAIDKEVLFVHGITKAEVDSWFKTIVNSFEEVNSITSWESEIDPINRAYELTYVVKTDYGNVAGYTTTERPDVSIEYKVGQQPSQTIACEFEDLVNQANRIHFSINNVYPT